MGEWVWVRVIVGVIQPGQSVDIPKERSDRGILPAEIEPFLSKILRFAQDDKHALPLDATLLPCNLSPGIPIQYSR
jgi:hypothetical protein